jgi:hypothetical protein
MNVAREPWRIEIRARRGVVQIVDADNCVVAALNGLIPDPIAVRLVHLLAAAPDLLAALRQFVQEDGHLGSCLATQPQARGAGRACRPECEITRTAIARANGANEPPTPRGAAGEGRP